MKTTAAGAQVTVRVPLLDPSGETCGGVLAATSLRYRILDELEEVISPWSGPIVPSAGQAEIQVVVPGALNILTPPATRGMRVIEVEVTTPDKVVVVSESLLIQSNTTLEFGVNSMLRYPEALLLAEDFATGQLTGWAGADRTNREKALIQAWERILMLPMGLQFDDTQSILYVDTEFLAFSGPIMLRELAPTQLDALYPAMKAAIKKAQLVEADEILSGDASQAAQNGTQLASRTVGESTDVFRQGSPALVLPVSKRALNYLKRWVRFGAKIVRS